ncbi:MAG: hypothetical protein CMN32_13770 [Saprospirales bacterium]|nr:hypothetical protein [Saprospirales bacterium]
MEKYGDLRFIIGSFFFLSGIVLLVLAFTVASQKTYGYELNLYSGLGITLFGAFMIWLHRRDKG